ncbi:hypothetical protein C8Q74DRAFT_915157 [Fomes fomentarius]|nr:hypothetical protein C8Q74DRAFT_915157 [Fomes fomentarius]
MDRIREQLQVEQAWTIPFVGNSHTFLVAALQKMYTDSLEEHRDMKGCTRSYTAIIQSSGSGKSRMVDEAAKRIFTIPFNIRLAEDSKDGAWPPPDSMIQGWLVRAGTSADAKKLSRRYLCFFQAVFEETAKAIRQFESVGSPEEFALCFYKHLASAPRRDQLYQSVLRRANELVYKLESFEIAGEMKVDMAAFRALQDHDKTIQRDTREALRTLVSLVHERSNSLTSDHSITTPKLASASADTKITSLHVFIYFDEAHTLAECASDYRSRSGWNPLDIFVRTLDRFQHCGAFTALLSTQSEYLAPSSSYISAAPSRELVGNMHAPITETPYDCVPSILTPSDFKADDIGKVAYMANFGRPLWRTMLPTNADGTINHSSIYLEEDCYTLLGFARTKLLWHRYIDQSRETYTHEAQIATLDVRLMLSYKVYSPLAVQLQMDLVASHMRTVYSFPRDRECPYSGYSSEPILAEAAARQLAAWREKDKVYTGFEPAVAILWDNIDLFAHDDICEVLGRLLLTLAHDHAVMTSYVAWERYYSRPISVEAFFKALFQEQVAERVLNSVPDNHPEGQTLREVFKNAVLNFTHFVNWVDDEFSEHVALGCFMRNMALICRSKHSLVDVFLPIVLDRTAPLGPEVMSGIFVQFKLRGSSRSLSAYAFDEKDIDFFSPDEEAEGKTLRPYITLIMQPGVVTPTSLLARMHTNPPSQTANTSQAQASGADTQQVHVDSGPPDATFEGPHPPRPGTPQPVQQQEEEEEEEEEEEAAGHPRYSMYVHGCLHSVYNVVSKLGEGTYARIIRYYDLGQHTRVDPESLAMMRNLKPTFGAASWSWTKLGKQILEADGSTAVDWQGDRCNIFFGDEIQAVTEDGF